MEQEKNSVKSTEEKTQQELLAEALKGPIPEHVMNMPPSEPPKKKRGEVLKQELIGWLMVIVIAVAVAFLVSHFLIANTYVPSSSMEETIMTDDRIIGLRTAYWFSEPERGDVIIFKYPDDETQTFIKRVIGLPGETVTIVDGLVFINDSRDALVEPYVKGTPSGSYGPYEVPEDCYFVLGDNREISKDSRYWKNTYVSRDKIMAKAFLRYYPSFKLLN